MALFCCLVMGPAVPAVRSDRGGTCPATTWRTTSPMRSPRKLVTGLGLLAVAGTVAPIGAGPLLVSGADHLDPPLVKIDARVDITDIYAWRTSPTTTTLALNDNPLTPPADTDGARFR